MLSASRGASSAWPRLSGKTWLVLLVGLLTLGLWHASQWRFVCDDAYIALRYAQNWVQSGFPSYNPELPDPVQGFTSPLWVLLIAFAQLLGADAVQAALSLNALGSVVTALAAAGIVYALAPESTRRLASLLSLGALGLCPEFMVWSSGGLETSLATAFGMLSVWALCTRRYALFHLCAALAACTRLDTLVWVLPLAFGLGKGRVQDIWRRPSVGAWGLVGLSLLGAYLAYGSLLPQTFAIKSGSMDLARRYGVAYLRQWAVGAGLVIPALMLLLQTKKNMPWLVAVGANLLYVLWVGGDFMGYSRFLLPATVMVLLMASVSLARVAAMPARFSSRAALVTALVGLLLLALRISPRLAQDKKEAWLDRRYESVHAMERFAAVRVAAGKAFAQRWPANTRVTVGAAGAFAYASGLTAFDAYGLTDASVLTLGQHQPQGRPGHRWVGGRKWVRAHQPHLRCEIGWVGGPGFPSKASLKARKPVTKGAGWTCRSTGPVFLRGVSQPLEPQHYCCVRERFSDPPEK